MSDGGSHPEHHEGHLRGLVERINEHHDRAVQHRQEDDLARAADQAGFDLGADIGHPTPQHRAASFDIDGDIGIENEPPELRE
jgi:hypothetical protein